MGVINYFFLSFFLSLFVIILKGKMDIESIAHQLRKWKIILGAKLNKIHRKATTDEILQIAEEICPTKYSFGGGQLFLSWFLENGKQSMYDWATSETDGWSARLRAHIRAVEVPRWVMHIISSTNHISQKNTVQLFYPSLVLEWKGLSRTGMDIYATLGASLKTKQYLDMKAVLAKTEKATSLQILATNNPVIWVDNFSKIYSNPFYRLDVGVYREANYTAMAMMYDSRVVDMQFRYIANRTLIFGCSTMMLQDCFLERVTDLFDDINNYSRVEYYDTCAAQHEDYMNFIVSPSHENLENDVYRDSPNGMKDFRTFGMLDANISDQAGLVKVFDYITSLLPEKKYQSLVVDPGIYWRAYRVLQKKRGGGGNYEGMGG